MAPVESPVWADGFCGDAIEVGVEVEVGGDDEDVDVIGAKLYPWIGMPRTAVAVVRVEEFIVTPPAVFKVCL